MSDVAAPAPPADAEPAPGASALESLTGEEKQALVALLQAAPTLRAALGPSIHPPGDPHYTWDDFTRDSPEAQAQVLAQAQELAQALEQIAALQKQLAAAKAQMDPAARKAELEAELAAVNAQIAPADASGAALGAAGAPPAPEPVPANAPPAGAAPLA